MSVIAKARKGLSIFYHRIRYQGLGVTLAWAIGRGVPKLTGVPLLRYSRITPTVYVGPQFNQRGKRALEKKVSSATSTCVLSLMMPLTGWPWLNIVICRRLTMPPDDGPFARRYGVRRTDC